MEKIPMRTALILGASGLVGKAVTNEFKDAFDLFGTYSTSTTHLPKEKQFRLDVHEVDRLQRMMRAIKPDIVISCLRGDLEQQLSFHKALAAELVNTHSSVYFLSSANVFDGDYSKHHFETDGPIAESEYGQVKIQCENALKDTLDSRAVIIRTPMIWGVESPRMNQVRDSIEKNQPVDVYGNLECNNISDTQLAKQLHYIVENELRGIFHLGAVDMMTHADFFAQIVNALSPQRNLLKFNLYNDTANVYRWGLISTRTDIPDSLQITNQAIISHLLQ